MAHPGFGKGGGTIGGLREKSPAANEFLRFSHKKNTQVSAFLYRKRECILGPAKVNKVKMFSGPFYMVKRIGLLTFVLGVQESVLLDYISQNKVKILHQVKTCQNCLH